MAPKKKNDSKHVAAPSLLGFRIATYLLLFQAAGHTVGGMLLPYDFGPAGNALFRSMQTTTFDFFGAQTTFYSFHMGFGLIVSVFTVLSAGLAYHLANTRPPTSALRPVAWMLFVAWLPMPVLSFHYFFLGPAVATTVIVVVLGWECFTTYR